ncbi:MAG: hypothetical protein FD147_2281, partial [Chloroflexi bacterium]
GYLDNSIISKKTPALERMSYPCDKIKPFEDEPKGKNDRKIKAMGQTT